MLGRILLFLTLALVPASVATATVSVNIGSSPYNCVGNGVDCWDGWESAMQYVSSNGGGTVTVPPSNAGSYYYVRKPLYFYSGVSLVFQDTNTTVKLNYSVTDADRLHGYEFAFGNVNQYGGGDHDISINGGVWDCNAYVTSGSTILSSQRKIFANGAYNIGVQFIGVTNLSLSNMTIKNSRNWGTMFNQCHNVTLNGITFNQMTYGVPDNQDGIHFVGENSDITATNIGGTTYDDIFALTTADTALGPRVKFGPINNVVLDGLNCANSLNGIRVGLAGELIDNVTIRNVTGTVRDYRGINIEAYNYFKPFGYAGRDKIGHLTLENINLANQSTSYPSIYIDVLIDKLTLKNITKNSPAGQPLLYIADNSSALSMGQINDLTIDGVTSAVTNTVPLIANYGVINNLTVKNWSGLSSSYFIQYYARSGFKESLNIFDNPTFSTKVYADPTRQLTVNNYTTSTPPPDLSIDYPAGDDIQTHSYTSPAITVSGTVTPGSSLTVDGQSVTVIDGVWSTPFTLAAWGNNVPVVASNGGISVTKYLYMNRPTTTAPSRPTGISYDGTNLSWTAVPSAVSYRIYYSSSDGRSDGRSSWGDGGVQNPGPFLQNFIFGTATRRYPNSTTAYDAPTCNFASGLTGGAWYLVSVSAVDVSGNESPISFQREVQVGTPGIYPDNAATLAGLLASRSLYRALRSPSGGKIRGKGAGKVSGKPQ